MTPDELRAAVKRIEWWHQIPLEHGIVTPGPDHTGDRIRLLGLPEDLTGMRVLDIGAWDGAFSFECERRGARYVLAIDEYVWAGKCWASKEGFDFAHKVLRSRVKSKLMDVYHLSPRKVGVFDLVLFSGVLYHLKHPLLALERIAGVTHRHLILSSHIDLMDIARPAIAFYPGSELNNDATNWVGPNIPALQGMLLTAGFRRVELHASSIEDHWAVMHAWK